MKIVPDTSVVIDGRVTALVEKGGEYENATIIIPEAVFAELEAQANQGREIGFSGLAELQKLTLLAKDGKIQLQYVGERPKLDQVKLAGGGEIDSMIRAVAIEHQATFLTSDYVQSEVAKAKGIDVIFLKSETSTTFAPLLIDEFFDENTFAVYLKERVAPYARKGTIKESKLVNIRDAPCTEHELRAISQECLERAKRHPDGFVEVELPGVTVSQIGSMRITTTRPPFSDGIEVTIVRPTREVSFESYNFAAALKDRLKESSGMLVVGTPGSGKSTLEQNIATYLSSENYIVKTIESPRDLMVADRITQYTSLDGSISAAGEVLTLLRPDYVIFDEMRRSEELAVYADLRLSGIKVVGGLHAKSALDALIRLASLVDLNLIPQIVTTMVFVKTGDISEIYNVSIGFSVPKALEQIGDPQIRPVVRLTNIITTEIVAEAFRYEGEVMVTPASGLPEAPKIKTVESIKAEAVKAAPVPVSAPVVEETIEEEYASEEEAYDYDRQAPAVHSMPTYEVTSDNPAWVVLEKEIQNEISRFTEGEIVVRVISDTKAAVYIEDNDVPAAIGKAGKNIAAVVSKVGVGIDVRPLSDLPGREALFDDVPVSTPAQGAPGFQIRNEKKQISIICPEHTGKIVDLFSGKEYLFTATVDNRGEIHLARNSSIALEMVRRYGAGEDLKLRPVD
ncbi:MAG TPA: PINc/VapC family ATPase [Methanocorpusculum sp.]|nr:PINc/VapC family ATPase [Methanocorpusculum sp.]HJJ39740.1 PINc/VapC family ATPase [Methanocorpusculum sp.]HJJ49349.1 PINc/VapC family ATPase [Methanocorpusculum sp.]HJJ56607.1 PINc/VapC family ATPase [Methanocorpusculum sp.]